MFPTLHNDHHKPLHGAHLEPLPPFSIQHTLRRIYIECAAHATFLDQVTEKTPDKQFDFMTQGIDLVIDGDWLKARAGML